MTRNTPALAGFILSVIAAGGAFIVGLSPLRGGADIVVLVLLSFPGVAGFILGIIGALNAKRDGGSGQGYASAAIVLPILMYLAFLIGGFLGRLIGI